MLVVMVGLLSGALWWEGWGRPGAARSSPGEPRRARRALEQLWASPGQPKTPQLTYGVVVLLQQTTLSNTDTGEYEPGKGPATIDMLLVVNGT